METADARPGTTSAAAGGNALLDELLRLERAAMKRWGAGDPDGFLEINAQDVTYFDPWQSRRLDSHAELAALYDGLRGQVHIEEFEFVAPRVQAAGDLAVLTFQFVSKGSEGAMHWNTTEVYRREPDGAWRIVHSHWSLTEVGHRLGGAPDPK